MIPGRVAEQRQRTAQRERELWALDVASLNARLRAACVYRAPRNASPSQRTDVEEIVADLARHEVANEMQIEQSRRDAAALERDRA